MTSTRWTVNTPFYGEPISFAQLAWAEARIRFPSERLAIGHSHQQEVAEMPEELCNHSSVLETLARCDADALKRFAEALLEDVNDIDVVTNGTGLVMLPFRDTVKGTAFHLGEVLMSQARIRMLGEEGYGLRTGRDLEAVLAMAIVDAAWQARHAREAIDDFVKEQADAITTVDNDRLRDVEATRVNMETF